MPKSWMDMVLQDTLYGLTGVTIPDLSFEFKYSYLTAYDVQCVTLLLNKCIECLNAFPPSLKLYKTISGKFIKSLLSYLSSYIKLLKKLNSGVTSNNINDFKQKINKLYDDIKKLCDDRELVRFSAKMLNPLFAKAKLVTKPNSFIGDFASNFKDFLDKVNLNDLNENNISNKLIGPLGQRDQLLRIYTNAINNAKGTLSGKVFKEGMQLVTPMVRGISEAEALYNPIEGYHFGKFIDYDAAGACEISLKAYVTTINGYPIELSNYKKDCLDIIKFLLPKLNEYIRALKSISKPEISFKEIITLKTKVYNILSLLKSKCVVALRQGSNIYKVMIRAVDRGEKPKPDYIRTNDAKHKAIIIDGWSLGTFLTPFLECVNNTIESLDDLIDSAEGIVDYDALGIKEPQKTDSKVTRIGNAVSNFFTSPKSKESADLLKKHKFLISYLNDAQKLYNNSKLMVKNVDDLKQLLEKNSIKIDEASFEARQKEIQDNAEELEKIYRRVSCDEKHDYRDLDKSPVLIKNGKIVLSSSVVLPLWTSDEYNLLIDYVSRDVSKMQDQYNALSENANDLLRAHKNTVSDILKERSKLSDLLKDVIGIKKQADIIHDEFLNWEYHVLAVFFVGFVPPSEQSWFDEARRNVDNIWSSVYGIYDNFKNFVFPFDVNGRPLQLALIGGDNKPKSDTINGIPLSQIGDIIKHLAGLVDILRGDCAQLRAKVNSVSKEFENKKKLIISERSKLEKVLKQTVELMRDAYKYTGEARKVIANIDCLSEGKKNEFEELYNDVVDARNTVSTSFGAISRYKPDGLDATYNFIDVKNNIGNGVKQLDLSQLKQAIKDCSEANTDLKKAAKDMATKEENLFKSFNKEISTLEENRKKLEKAFSEMDEIYKGAKDDYDKMCKVQEPAPIGKDQFAKVDGLRRTRNKVEKVYQLLSDTIEDFRKYRNVDMLSSDTLKGAISECSGSLRDLKRKQKEIHSGADAFINGMKKLSKVR